MLKHEIHAFYTYKKNVFAKTYKFVKSECFDEAFYCTVKNLFSGKKPFWKRVQFQKHY